MQYLTVDVTQLSRRGRWSVEGVKETTEEVKQPAPEMLQAVESVCDHRRRCRALVMQGLAVTIVTSRQGGGQFGAWSRSGVQPRLGSEDVAIIPEAGMVCFQGFREKCVVVEPAVRRVCGGGTAPASSETMVRKVGNSRSQGVMAWGLSV